MQISVTDNGGNKKLICKTESNDKLDPVTLHMLMAQRIDGILDEDGNYNRELWNYDCSGLVDMSTYLAEGISREKCLKLLRSIAETLESLKDYMIPCGRMLLKQEWIWIEPTDGWTYLVCLPVENFGGEWTLQKLCRTVVKSVKTDPAITHKYLDLLQDFAQSSSGKSNDFLKVVENCEKIKEQPIEVKPVENIETVVWNNVRGMLVRKRNGQRHMMEKAEEVIGKDYRSVDLCIMENPTISRRHAKIVNRENRYFISDCQSTNHTYVNGRMLIQGEEQELKSGDIVRLSNEEFLFQMV